MSNQSNKGTINPDTKIDAGSTLLKPTKKIEAKLTKNKDGSCDVICTEPLSYFTERNKLETTGVGRVNVPFFVGEHYVKNRLAQPVS